ncbi:DEAH-box RNA-dependent ATPase [Saccharomycopsis crataegensis]|uniref:RNA helicase n=1 Tax=Saccharomycopsis crataegensis TaxID=43959 RepID=A0AAV5QJA7_9ASCO|nr:DEAH-box RNA-dependent ATPase [Saccharomycopsis crataegensis]
MSSGEDLSELRKLARQSYLSRREETKLLVLKQEVIEYNNDIKDYGWSNLSKREQDDYEYKKEILDIVLQRRDLSDQIYNQLNFNYELPKDYFTEDNKIDKKRKKDLLNVRKSQGRGEPNDQSSFQTWESNQRKSMLVTSGNMKLEENFEDPTSLNLPGSENYEFVFDDSQNINFVNSDEKLSIVDELSEIRDEKHEETRLKDEERRAKKKSIEETKKSLPVYKYKQDIIDAIKKYQILIFVGETGSGKTTQLPQYLYEAGLCNNFDNDDTTTYKKIAITQPRRVAATSVATRVAEEMGFKLGNEVGYTIRFDDKSSEKTLIKYVTDGMLLREFLIDPEMKSYSAIIIDEAHERTISTDILLGLLKDIVKINKDLKVIISSATVNSKKFSDFFGNVPIFNVPGRRYPVDIFYTEQPESNYLFASVTTIFQIHLSQDTPGDILVFLTGQEEIEAIEEILKDTCAKLGNKIKPLIIAPIYSNLPIELQTKIFEPTPQGSRKVVLATNIAETSITIDGIKYVIDPGFVKEKVFNPTTGMESLVVVPCSQASAQQRAGRAGRVGPGKCFRLYTKWSFKNELPKQPTPEILRSNLSGIILMLLSLGIYDILNFEFLDKPSNDLLIKSLELLYALGAMNEAGELTKLGKVMSEFPLDPMFSKVLITGNRKNCLSEILSIVSMLTESGSLFYVPKNNKEMAQKAKENFNNRYKDHGDHFMYLEVWNQWVDNGYSYQWCKDNFIQHKTLNRIRNVRNQLERLCGKNELFIQESSNSSLNRKPSDDDDDNDDSFKKLILNVKISIASGFFPNTSKLTKSGTSYRNLKKQQEVFIHPSSSLFKKKPPVKLLIYNELVLTTKEYMRNVLVIDDERILKDYASHYFNEEALNEIENANSSKRNNKMNP